MIDDLAILFHRELASLEAELQLFPDDRGVWATVPGLPNSAGTLTLHLCGNLRHFVGGILGKTGYVRDRDAEFSRRDESRAALIEEVRTTSREVESALRQLDPRVMSTDFPILVGKGIQTTTQPFLLHLAVHLGYHLGQIDYARRAVTGDAASAGTLPRTAREPLN